MAVRRRTKSGHLLHCCCICSTLEPWGSDWFWYGSYKEEEDGVSIPKFCSQVCKMKGGPNAKNVIRAQRMHAQQMEMVEPMPVYRPRSYGDAVSDQQRDQ